MKSYLYLILTTFLFLLSGGSFAQTKVISVDTVSGVPSETLPFDQAFVLKVPIKAARVTAIAFMPHVGRKTFKESLEHRDIDFRSKNPGLQPTINDYKIVELDSKDYSVKKLDGKNHILINFKNPNLLDPGKQYTLFWVQESDPVVRLFDQYRLHKKGVAGAFAKAQNIYNQLAQANIDNIGIDLGFPSNLSATLTGPGSIDSHYNDSSLDLSTKYTTLETRIDAYNRKIAGLSTDNQLKGNVSLRIILQEFSQKSNNFDSEGKSSYLKDIRQSSQRVISLFSIDNTTYKNIILGLQNLDCNKCKLTEFDLYDDRAENLKTTLAAVEELYIVSESLVKGQPSLQGAVDGLKAFRNELRDLITDFDGIVAARKAIKDNIFEIGLGPVFALGGSTFIFNFETRNKLSLAPDFGFVSTRIGNDGSNPYSFVPYLGFHVNFRPINRDIPFKSYNHKPLHYGSLFIGWSLVSIDNGPKQSAGVDSVASFFSKGKGTLLTGLGIRLGNAVRITAGGMWYFKYFLDPTDLTKTKYNKRSLQAWPFVGISLDLSLKDLLNGISDVFTGVPRGFRPPTQTITSN